MTFLLHGYLERSAAARPDHPAVVTDERTLAYAQLDGMASRVSSALVRAGVRRGDRVALFAPKRAETVAALYGILKAGAAYVPIDPGSPAPRAGYIARDCSVAAVVADADRLAVLGPEIEGEDVHLVLDLDALDELPEPSADRPEAVDTDLAYILSTSGSTGHPKGVMLSHRNAGTFVEWAAGALGLRADDRFSGHAPLHFDLSVFDLYASARVGGTLYPLSPQDMSMGLESAELVHRHALTVWYSVPSALVMWVTQGRVDPAALSSLRHVVFAGEVFPTPYLRRLAGLLPGATLHNWYGPTETNVCTHYVVGELPEGSDEPIPIGRPCANYDCFAVAPDGTLAGPGQEGELYVRGSGVMLGYWGQAERTAEVLVQNPLHDLRPDPCYRTGDLVVPTDDGAFRFLGRRDHQVKTRGYRVELGEVEAAIHAHPAVREACVVAVPDERMGHSLLAYVALAEGSELSPIQLRRHVSERLPRYMVPSDVRVEAALPRTSTGKVDRQALAKMAAEEG
ncbi:MAG: amino acid adenylation domain-containing protein [Actinobacteria bacterium]|nr:amino acid adenylation domain-containing protein [Actinomycetota bacterium]